MPSPADPPSCCLLHVLHLFRLSFIIGMPNRSCILELRANQCLLCNFLRMLRCKSQIPLSHSKFRFPIYGFSLVCMFSPSYFSSVYVSHCIGNQQRRNLGIAIEFVQQPVQPMCDIFVFFSSPEPKDWTQLASVQT